MSRSLLREMGVGEILDAAFGLYRAHFVDMLKLGGLLLVPVLALALVEPLLGNIAQIFAGLAVTVAMMKRGAGHIVEEPTTYKQCLWTGARKWFPVFAASLFIGFLTFIGFLLFIVPGVLLTAAWFAWMPVMVLEDDWGFPSRSTALSKGAWAKILIVKLISMIILVLPFAIIGVAGALNETPTTNPFDEAVPTRIELVATVALAWLTTPFSVFVDLMLYYERRVALEGFDVELATRDLEAGEAAASA